jgi:GH24 family phage-related lysozyme (muramidase)
MDQKKFWKQIKIHEGVRRQVYLDTTNHRTVGVGFNLERPDAERILRSVGANYQDVVRGEYQLSNEQMRLIFEQDLKTLEEEARSAVSNYDNLSDVRQRVVCDMLFNLGYGGFKKFKSTINHIEHERFDRAADQMLESLWSRQVGQRSRMLSHMMRYDKDTYDL